MFITFEGLEGSGKTSQIPILEKFLDQEGYTVYCTREPGGTVIGDQIREVLLSRENTAMNDRAEVLLFQASRAQNVEAIIRPRLAAGEIVLSDRFADSTIAYQGYGLQLDLALVHAVVNFATGGLKPDLTLLLDVDVEEGLRRRKGGRNVNRLDVKELEYYRRVQVGYQELVKAEPERWVVINANQPPKQVQEEMRRVILERLKAPNT